MPKDLVNEVFFMGENIIDDDLSFLFELFPFC